MADMLQSDSLVLREGPASTGQRLLWFLDHYRAGAGAALNCPVVFQLDGGFDLDRLNDAVRRLIARHEALRTTVERRGRKFWQVVHEVPEVRLSVRDVGAVSDPAGEMERELEAELRTRISPTDLPVRMSVWKLAPDRHVCCLNVHHMASDAWSGANQMRDLVLLYEGRTQPPPELQYKDFTVRQEEYFASARFKRDMDYWRSYLSNASFDAVPLSLADDRPRVTGRMFISVGADEAARLTTRARDSKTSLFSLMLALYFTALYRLTGKSDLCVASLFANRLAPNIQDTVGFIANLAVLRVLLRPKQTFRSFLQLVQSHLREAFIHQAFPFHLLPANVTVRGGRRADEAVFQMIPAAFDSQRMGDAEATMLIPKAIESRFDFEVTVVMQQGLTIMVLWNENRLARDWVEQFSQEYEQGVARLSRDMDWPVES